ncbi:response regulator [bacterium]|nr:response regulator [bacterium]
MEKQIKILMIEDDPFFGKLCARVLEDEGFLITLAKDGEQGLKKLEEERPDLVLLDIILPKMNGFEVLEGIRKNPDPELAGTHVIILSNLYSEEEEKKARELKADGYLVKANTTSDELLKKVREVLAQGSGK